MVGQAWRPGVQNSQTREDKEAACTWWFLIPRGGNIHNYKSHGRSEDCCLGTCNLAGEFNWKKTAMLASLTWNKWPQARMSPWSCLLTTQSFQSPFSLLICKTIPYLLLSPETPNTFSPHHLLPISLRKKKKKEETIKQHHPPTYDLCASQYCEGQC